MFENSRQHYSLLLFLVGFLLQMSFMVLGGNLVAYQHPHSPSYVEWVVLGLVGPVFTVFVPMFIGMYGLYQGFSEMFRQKKIFFSCLIGIFFNLLWVLFLIGGLILSFLGYV